MKKIGKYFSVEELTVTDTGLPNQPATSELVNLRNLVESVLDPAREKIGIPIKVNSGYRCPAVNAHTIVRGAKTSQHLKGEAADLDCLDNAKLFNIIADNFLFDQLIWEGGDDKQPDWVHVSYTTQGNRSEVLRMRKVGDKTTYTRM